MTATPGVAIVTGAARGIGAAVATRLAADGHAVALVDRHARDCAAAVAAITQSGRTARAFAADVADEQAASAAVAEVARHLGPPTILVNNAGILRDNLLFRMTLDDWDQVIQVHLRGTFLMTRATQKHMVQAGFGRIVNVSSTSALGNRGQANYSAAKAGIQGLTKTLAIELGKFGVTANAVAPGFIETEMTRATAARMGMDFDDFRVSLVQQIPVGRAGRPDDVAAAVSYLVSAEAGYVSGQVIYIAGGPTD